MEKRISMSNRDILDAINTLNFVIKKVESGELIVEDPVFPYVIGRNLRLLKESIVDYNQAKNDALRELGEYKETENGPVYSINMKDKEQFGAFDFRVKKLLDIKHDVELYAVPIDVVSSWKLPFGIQAALYFLVQEDELYPIK